jgi:hypothetical protein
MKRLSQQLKSVFALAFVPPAASKYLIFHVSIRFIHVSAERATNIKTRTRVVYFLQAKVFYISRSHKQTRTNAFVHYSDINFPSQLESVLYNVLGL